MPALCLYIPRNYLATAHHLELDHFMPMQAAGLGEALRPLDSAAQEHSTPMQPFHSHEQRLNTHTIEFMEDLWPQLVREGKEIQYI